MLSSAGLNSPPLRARLLLAALALVALAVALLLAFVSVLPRPAANRDGARSPVAGQRSGADARGTAAQKPTVAPTVQPPAVSPADNAAAEQPPMLWALLAPWAFAADAIALLGLAAVLIVRRNARRRGART